jgi:hypothetical protein
VIGCVAAAAACNKNHTRELRKEINVRGGAVMPHALINCRTDVRRSGISGYQPCLLLRCPPESGVNSSEDTQIHRARRKPPGRCE